MTAPGLTLLFDLTIRGSILVMLLLALDFSAACWFAGRHRRLLWLLAPAAFLLPWWFRIPVLPAFVAPGMGNDSAHPIGAAFFGAGRVLATGPHAAFEPLAMLWFLGVLAGMGIVAVRSFNASRLWSGSRFSTDPALLEAVEDCRVLAGVRAPVGVIVSDRIESPALLGWLRPKMLLPEHWTNTCPKAQLRDVLLHELAHLRSADLAWSWLFTAMRLVHWFNPLAHLAAWRWNAVREDAADELVMRLRPAAAASYGETLLAFLKARRSTPPFGALGISENFLNLKHRIQMIQSHPRRVVPALLASLLIAALAAAIFLRPAQAEPSEADSKAAAVAAMTSWLKSADDGDYAKSWSDASEMFRKAITQDKWIAALKDVRTPLGACKKRDLASVAIQQDISKPDGEMLKGEFALAQFKTSFANLFSAIETVTFERESDGSWRASGYYIKPAM